LLFNVVCVCVGSFQRFFVLLHLNEHIPKDPEAVLLIPHLIQVASSVSSF
jgi:hypothetical protein